MSYIHFSDKRVAEGIYVSGFAFYNKKLRDKSSLASEVIHKTLPVFRTLLNIPKDVKFRVAPIKARGVKGRYFSGGKVVEIDPRQDFFSLMNVIAHELVHAEQYHENRLVHTYVRGKGFMHMWYGDEVNNKGTTYRAYREQPWEIEAFERQAKLAEKVNDILECEVTK